jgi:salicylate hydroxylase
LLHNPRMTTSVLIAGGGIGGLAAALALSRAGVSVELLERADRFREVGAGLQLGPNALRVLNDWGLMKDLRAVAAFPAEINARDAYSGARLGKLTLGAHFEKRYGHPYATVHRADLHRMLFAAVQAVPGLHLHLATRVQAIDAGSHGVKVQTEQGGWVAQADAFVAADGVWSQVRLLMDRDNVAMPTGHLAYRGLVAASDLPANVPTDRVVAWLGPRMHVVHYPVRSGAWLNVVAVVHGQLNPEYKAHAWSHEAQHSELMQALGHVHADVRQVLDRVPGWTLWALHDRPPEQGPDFHAQGRVAWLGDAAHPMRPYLAQGAAMALEDAWTLGRLAIGAEPADWPVLLQRYAHTRWQRNARVQACAVHNGEIFHASGPLRMARNLGLAVASEWLMDNPWLYNGPPEPAALPTPD